jgi:hypothetical protein
VTETELRKQIIDALNGHPHVIVWKSNTGRRGKIRFGRKGSCDITGVYKDGRRIEIEVKLPGNNNFEPDQVPFMDEMRRAGAIVGVAHSVEEAFDIIFPKEHPATCRKSLSK